ncbi:MAG: hypothetical protein AABY93_18115 [Bacteroidota bacterium]
MKKSIITISLIFACVFAYAQATETELVRSVFKLEKKALVADFLQLSNDDATKFWPIYEKYEQERSAIGTRRIALLESYVNKYDKMDDVSLDALVKESGSIQSKEVSLREKYYKTVKKSVSTSVAARFYQVEDLINVGVRMELYEALPMLQGK